MSSLTHKEKKILGIIFVPLSFLIICYLLLFVVLQPILTPLYSIYSLLSSENKMSYTEDVKDLYEGNSLENKTFEVPQRGSVYGELSIEKLGINYPLYYGDSSNELNQGLGTYPGSSLPGFEKTVLVGGHTIPFLLNIDQLKIKDTIKVKTFYGLYEYQISDIKIGDQNDASMYDLAQEKEDMLVLYTCYPLDGIGYKSQRYFVYAQKVLGSTIKK